jgi:NTE family protein
VVGGAGERAIAWQTGVLAGLTDAGVDVRAANAILGTSAGAIAAAKVAAGHDPRTDADRIAATSPPHVPGQLRSAVSETVPKLQRIVWESGSDGDETERRKRAGRFAVHWRGILSVDAHVARQETLLPDVSWPRSLLLVAIDVETGERVVLDASTGARLAEGVAASRAVPGLVEPLNVEGRRLIDGALGSATNADLIPDDLGFAVIITATPSKPQPGSLDALWNEALEAERSTLAARWVRAVVVHASPQAVDAMGDDLMSADGAPTAVTIGREDGAGIGAELLARATR